MLLLLFSCILSPKSQLPKEQLFHNLFDYTELFVHNQRFSSLLSRGLESRPIMAFIPKYNLAVFPMSDNENDHIGDKLKRAGKFR